MTKILEDSILSGHGKFYDVIIVDAGSAGVTAPIHATRKKVDFAALTVDGGGQVIYLSEVENYTGF
ncbi:MAG: hypothetical protein FGF50_10615 [Candidatus Brockarchaeota archaeon]|nr:hypothetical protein [Candidatus Brockarchaeota archaeon]